MKMTLKKLKSVIVLGLLSGITISSYGQDKWMRYSDS